MCDLVAAVRVRPGNTRQAISRHVVGCAEELGLATEIDDSTGFWGAAPCFEQKPDRIGGTIPPEICAKKRFRLYW